MNKIISILIVLIVVLTVSCSTKEDSEKNKSFLEWLFEEEELTYEINDVPIKKSLKRVLKLEEIDSIQIIDGIDIKSSWGNNYSYFKYRASREFIFNLIRNLPLGEHVETSQSHSELVPISWKEIKGDMQHLLDSFPDSFDFWDVENIGVKECFECIKPPLSHRIVITENDMIYHMVRPLWEGEYFYKFNPQVQKLQNMLDDSLAQRNLRWFYWGPEFSRDLYYYPIKFPFSITAFESTDHARFIRKDSEVGCSFYFDESQCFDGYISRFNFDEKYILLELEDCVIRVDSNVGKYEKIKIPTEKYVIIDMNTCEKSFFKTIDDLYKGAKKLNYNGDSILITVKEYEKLFYTKNN